MQPDTKPAAKAVTGRKDRHREGYQTEYRKGTKGLSIQLPEEMLNALNVVAKAENTTVTAMIKDFVSKKTKDVLSESAREQLAKKEMERARARIQANFGVSKPL